ncbi:MAG TPA: DHA2 family efflux MFS transporter permease subunit [Acidimicrobiales bacterium]
MGRIPYKWVVATVFVAGVFMDLLDTSAVNVALPELSRQFGASVNQIEWVVLGYLLALAVSIPASGWVGDRFGTKRTYLFALAMFTGASVLCGLADTLAELTAFRILQGIGGGMLIPVGTAMLFRAFPPIERAKASTVLMLPTVLAPALGPLVGGWFVTNHSWEWIFFLNVPVGVAAFILGAIGLKEHREPAAGRFDGAGFVLSGGGLAAVLFALSHGPTDGWGSPAVLIPGLGGLLAFAALVWVETHIDEPMLALRLLKERMFRRANIVTMLAFSSFVGLLFLMPLFLQELLGLTAFESGLVVFPQAIGMVITSQICGRLYHSVGPRRLLVFGLVSMSVVSMGLLFIGFDTSMGTIGVIMFIRGLALGFVFVPIQAAAYANVAPSDTGRASAIFSALRQISASLGVAILATVLVESTSRFTEDAATETQVQQSTLDAFHFSFFVGSLLVLAAGASAMMIRDSDVAHTMRRYAEPERRIEPDEAVGIE